MPRILEIRTQHVKPAAETWLALIDYDDPDPPPGKGGGALNNPLINAISKFIVKYTSRDHHVELPYTITLPDPPGYD